MNAHAAAIADTQLTVLGNIHGLISSLEATQVSLRGDLDACRADLAASQQKQIELAAENQVLSNMLGFSPTLSNRVQMPSPRSEPVPQALSSIITAPAAPPEPDTGRDSTWTSPPLLAVSSNPAQDRKSVV